MAASQIELLKGDRRTREVMHWTRWLGRLRAMRRKFRKYAEDFDPLHFNEAASVALLANAASGSGLLALTEYVVQKRDLTRGRPFRRGRCDLWIADVASDMAWAFEVKQHFAAATVRQTTLDERLARALTDARRVDPAEADRRYGCLIVIPRYDAKPGTAMVHRIDNLCRNSAKVQIAFRIGGGREAVWLAFAAVG